MTSGQAAGPGPRVLLASMPWTTVNEPSLGLGILKGRLQESGIACRIRHFQIFLLSRLRADTYLGIAERFALNDFLFTGVLDSTPDAAQLAELARHADALIENGALGRADYAERERMMSVLLGLRNEHIPRYLDECADFVAEQQPTMVGLTCMFDQTIASVALAKRVRERLPEALIVLGGYALNDVTGRTVLASFPWLDVVCQGEAEDAITALAHASLDRGLLATIPGALYRDGPDGELNSGPPARRPNLNQSPLPDYGDWFSDLQELADRHRVEPVAHALPVETSRGCWWGQHHHCTFCGIDDETMRYRSKAPERALAMLVELRDRYGMDAFRISDYILPVEYFRTLLPALAELEPPLRLSCEIKANMTEEKFAALGAAGFAEVQPGIESFSTAVLHRMDKGVRAIQNVHTLVMGARNSVRIAFNVLYGFPDDEPDDYDEMLRLIPRLYHLDPPMTHTLVATTRYAPLQVDPGRFGIGRAPKPHAGYDVLFSAELISSSGFRVEDYCYYFDTPYELIRELRDRYQLLAVQLDHWSRRHSSGRPRLSHRTLPDGRMEISDSRYTDAPVMTVLNLDQSAVYRACMPKPVTVDDVQRAVAQEVEPEQVESILLGLDGARLTWSEGRRVLGLALPDEVYRRRTPLPSSSWEPPYVAGLPESRSGHREAVQSTP